MTDGAAFAKQIEDSIKTSPDVHSGFTYHAVQEMMKEHGVVPNDVTAIGARAKILQDALIPNLIVTSSQREMLGESVDALAGTPFISAIDSMRKIKLEP